MSVPLTAAQATASQMSTSGSAGLAGGFLPVAAFQDVLRPFFATAAAPSAATSENDRPDLAELSWMPCAEPYPAVGAASAPPARAATSSSGCRVLTSQYGVGSAGSVISTRTAALEVGPQQQVGPGVGVPPGQPAGRLGVERLDRAEVLEPRCGPGRRAARRRRRRPARAP